MHKPLTISHSQKQSPSRRNTRDRFYTPILLYWEEFLKLCIYCIQLNQSLNKARGICPRRVGSDVLVILWFVDGAKGTYAPSLPHRCSLFDRNATKWVCHVSPTRPIFPFEVVRLEDFRPLRLKAVFCLPHQSGCFQQQNTDLNLNPLVLDAVSYVPCQSACF